jgi:hypothetical protein
MWRCKSHCEYSERYQSKGQHADAEQVEAELAPGSEPCRRIKQRRQDDQEDDVGI